MIVIFGGTFNPPHIGHRIIAEYAYDYLKPDKFLIIPAYTPPHKLENSDIANYDKRIEWCKNTFPSERFEISRIEEKLDKPSYTLQTVKFLKEKYNDEIYLLIGEDSLISFHTWYKWKELLKNVTLVVYKRFSEKLKFENYNIEHIFLDSPIIEISSTNIRERIRKKLSIYGMVSDSIVDDILKTF
ncbi:nicotinate/nicotinamide nucleotide adenylyltransferase [Marinitoga piezophila KA3]|uniref:Probable nicotinate-nucleotide adenylyltransferase n=1 Tax=Marinitoga piezophila (strain DSM 14283 / JCM 11233 / KA3) TaxID=443254 RepID=H2J3X0_MARPK|nr:MULTISPECIES: nicotinate (nicotinamide) nucleotide adenylyltransferase [Marinitoga]AEX84698.1 nicotinate/nicotinamide nucleotide adenylyltransferase [Marinitoga piezophila KA3]APT75224.1 nicotinate-nucleotide adenylyltransferase [Marinitoga sp. 1137]NUU96960.1 nicotinate-nucleotide adenylyltransferase [Marinitoga sp. 1138]